MRKPLCKAKEVKTGKWVEGWYVPNHAVTDKDGDDVYAHILVENKDKTTDWVNVFADTVCEYTGCDDQYGVKIFVNDRIADEDGMTYNVVFYDYDQSFCAKLIHSLRNKFNIETYTKLSNVVYFGGRVINNKFDED